MEDSPFWPLRNVSSPDFDSYYTLYYPEVQRQGQEATLDIQGKPPKLRCKVWLDPKNEYIPKTPWTPQLKVFAWMS